MYNKLSRDFSWSLFKHNIFQFCEKAYYYHYYGSWNGWDQYESQENRISFRLKHLKSQHAWLKSILKKSLYSTIKLRRYNAKLFAIELKKQSQIILASDLRGIYSEAWKKDPKQICIDKIYYNEANIDDITPWIKKQVQKYVTLIQISKLTQKLSYIPYQAFINTEQPLLLKLNSLKVWFAPDLAWRQHGQLHTLNLNIHNNSWSFSAGINALLFSQKYNRPACNVISHTVFFSDNNCYEVYGTKPGSEIIKAIRGSADLMLSRLTYKRKAYIENFPKTYDKTKCSYCCFREICFKDMT